MIAVLDDDEPVRKAVLRLLRSAGYSACGFTSGTELLATWPQMQPDCVVLDLQMPGLSGLDVHRRLKSMGVRVSTILITASDEQDALDRCLMEGANCCLRKPLEGTLLLAAVAQARIDRETIESG